MKKSIYFFLLLLTIGLFSCKKENNVVQELDTFTPDNEIRNFLIESYEFLPSSITESKTGFIVEGDVYFAKKDFWERYGPPKNTSLRHYKSQYKVTLTTVYVDVSTLPTAWKTAFRSAITQWNGLKLRVKFSEVSGYCPANGITVQYASLGSNTSNVFAQAGGFPTSTGNPASLITVNSSCTVSMSSSQKLKTAVHELGHAIGFMHTDKASGYTRIIMSLTSCNTGIDPSSIMNQGLMSFTDFSACDKSAFKTIYP